MAMRIRNVPQTKKKSKNQLTILRRISMPTAKSRAKS